MTKDDADDMTVGPIVDDLEDILPNEGVTGIMDIVTAEELKDGMRVWLGGAIFTVKGNPSKPNSRGNVYVWFTNGHATFFHKAYVLEIAGDEMFPGKASY